MTATTTADRRITLYVAATFAHKVLVEVSGEGFAVPSAQVMTNGEAERFLTHVKGRYEGVEIIDAKPQRAWPNGGVAKLVDTYVVVSQTVTSDGICQNAGGWYSDQHEYGRHSEAIDAKAQKQRSDDKARRNRSSRAGYVFRSTVYRIWTAAEYDTFIATGRTPFGR